MPNPPEPRPVHFDWAPDAVREGTVPRCPVGDMATDSLKDVTCPECMDFIERVLGAWCRSVPKEAL